MAVSEYFASTYSGARAKFLAAASTAGANLTHHRLPKYRGPENEELLSTSQGWVRKTLKICLCSFLAHMALRVFAAQAARSVTLPINCMKPFHQRQVQCSFMP